MKNPVTFEPAETGPPVGTRSMQRDTRASTFSGESGEAGWQPRSQARVLQAAKPGYTIAGRDASRSRADGRRKERTMSLDEPNGGQQSLGSATAMRGWVSFRGTWVEKVELLAKNNEGLLLVAASQVFFSMVNVAVKKMSSIDPPVSALQLILIRMTITYLCCIMYMKFAKVPDPFLGPKGVRLLLVFRGITGFFGLFGVYYSLQYLSLSDATVLTFLAPMCTAVTGAVLLGETFTKRQALAGLVSLIGVVLIARPTSLFGGPEEPALEIPGDDAAGTPIPPASDGVTPSQRLGAVGVALVGVLGATGAYTTIRAIGKRAHPLHALSSFSIQCVLVSSIAMIVRQERFIVPTRVEWLLLLAMIGFLGFLAQVLLTMGLQRETASRGSMAIYTQVVFATVLERIFFGIVPSLLSAIGTFLIIASAIYVALSKSQPDGMKRVSQDDSELQRGYPSEHELLLDSDGDGDGDEHPRRAASFGDPAWYSRGSTSIDRDGVLDEDSDLALPLHEVKTCTETVR